MLEIPLNLRFKIQNDNSQLAPYIFAGTNTIFQIFSKNTYLYDNDTKEITINDNKFELLDLAPELGLGVEYIISQKIRLSLQSLLRFNLSYYPYTGASVINKLALGIIVLYDL